MKTKSLLICTALIAAGCGNTDRTIYTTDNYVWKGDSIIYINDGYKAWAQDSETLISEYPESEYDNGQWHLSRDLSQFADYKAPTVLEEAVHKLALEECINLVEPDSTLRTGKSWSGVWTRDVNYSTLLAMSHMQTRAAMISLKCKIDRNGKIIQDTGTGGSWPCSTDRMTWVFGAWELYKVTGDREWLETIYPVIKRSIDADIKVVFNPETGMMKGESSFLDWRKQEYPLWMNPVDIYSSECLGTECVHYRALGILAQMEKMLGSEEKAAEYESYAQKIKDGINDRLWMADKGFYAQYLYGRHSQIVSPRSETLGEALSILFGIASDEQAQTICASMPQQSWGASCFFPQIQGIPPYHNDAMWPFVQTFWMKACAKAGNEAGVMHGMASIYRMAATFLTNKENVVIYDGNWQGTEVNSSNMLWSISGCISSVYSILFGMQYELDGIHFTPFVPKAMAGERSLTGVKYRNCILDIELSGSGSGIRSFKIDGKSSEPFIPADMTGRHTVTIVMNGKAGSDAINLVENTYSPDTPVCTADRQNLDWNAVECESYTVLRDGKEVGKVTEPSFVVTKPGQYQVIANGADGYSSFASEPVDFGKAIEVSFKETVLTRDSGTFTTTAKVEEEGDYAIEFHYTNMNGKIEYENKCCVRTLWIDGQRIGTLALAQCGEGLPLIWKYSNTHIVKLTPGTHKVEITYEPEDENMNIDVNTATLDGMRLTRKF